MWWMRPPFISSMEEQIRFTESWFCLIVLCALITCTMTADTISANQTIRDGEGETIVSAQQNFELGFFSPPNSTNRYVGIWFKKVATGTVTWVANRNNPLTNTSGELSLTPHGTLVISNGIGGIIWSSKNLSVSSMRKPVGQLLDTGNFIIREETDSNMENYIWKSFDFPTDSFLAGMKIGKDLVTGIERHLTSWKSDDDPSSGEYTVWIDTKGYPQLVIRDGMDIVFRSGPWNGVRFSGMPLMRSNQFFRYVFVLDSKEVSFYFELVNASAVTRAIIRPTGSLERQLWNEDKKVLMNVTPLSDNCDRYALCGSFGVCNSSTVCACLEGFEPRSPTQWTVSDWTQGCRRSTPLDCGAKEGFKKYSGIKLPDTQWSWFNQTTNIGECKRFCKSNCSCTAYATQNISDGNGCLLWFSDLIDIRTLPENGQDLYIRMPASELENGKSSSVKRRVMISVLIVSVLLVILLSIYLYFRLKKKPNHGGALEEVHMYDPDCGNSNDDLELPLIGFSTLRNATDNFSSNNKLGEGGFGPVYKGVMENGQEVAVKRLARTSTQGLDEFKNEVICISKLQHRNLVQLLGCCIEGAEKMLVYEYMPNKGLDSFIFDETQSKVLDWPMRFHIIKGIARGLLYLHRDSRLRIIHRDLKVSNILLDHDMAPKISDFGMARSFGGNEIEANTTQVVGTYGYMAPEYAGDGLFSIKSDVYSFGVLVLEILSGKRNRLIVHKENSNNLIGYAWELHKDNRSLELVAASLDESVNFSEVTRSIHIGLLCVQQRPEDRPTMASVVHMFESNGELPIPKPPGFFNEKAKTASSYSSSTYQTNSTNELTITMLNAR